MGAEEDIANLLTVDTEVIAMTMVLEIDVGEMTVEVQRMTRADNR